jgi:8-oxo-dGTP pyrophosphatase MutT (NUDIX family)
MNLEVLGDGTGFKVRAAAVIVRGDRVLMHRKRDEDRWYLPGGTGEHGETTAETLVRELREELRIDAEVGRLLWVVEHLFETPNRRWHQLTWIFETSLPGDCDAVRRETWEHDEPEGPVVFRWLPFAELTATRHLPGFLATAIRDLPREPRHVVHEDRLA